MVGLAVTASYTGITMGMATYAGIQPISGAQTVNVPISAKSVTVAVTAGTVTVTITGASCSGTNVVIPAGVTMSWGVDDAGENINCSFAITGIAGTAALVGTTR